MALCCLTGVTSAWAAAATVTVAATDAAASETGPDTGTFTFTRVGDTTAALTVNFTVAGTAASTTDYAAIGTSVTFAAGSATATKTVTPVNDTTAELNETVILTIATGTGYTKGSPGAATVTIADNEAPVVTIAASDNKAMEPGTDKGTFTLTRKGDKTAALTVNFTTTGTATSGTDYTALVSPATIAAGAATGTVTVTALDDTVTEADETVIVKLAAGTGYTAGTPNAATVTIWDNESPTVSVAATDNKGVEPGTDKGKFTFTRLGNKTSALTVKFTVGGTATSGTDYTSIGTTVSIGANSASATKTVTPLNDTTAELDETVIVTLAAGTGYTAVSPTAATVTIADNEAPVVTVSATDATASEPGTDTGIFTFTRLGLKTAALTVKFAVGGTATSGTDYTALGTTVTIPAGQPTATKTVTPLNDTVVEPEETVVVTLATGTGYTPGTPGSATVTINDDEPLVAPASLAVTGTDSLRPAYAWTTQAGYLYDLSVAVKATGVEVRLDTGISSPFVSLVDLVSKTEYTWKVRPTLGTRVGAWVAGSDFMTNLAPVAQDQAPSTNEDAALAITLSATDADADPLTYQVLTQPSHGSLTGAAPNLTYTPNANYNGADSFTFKANDATADSNVATVSIHVLASFVITVKTDNAGTSAANQFTLPLQPGETYDFTVDYDGQHVTHNTDSNLTLTFPSGPGTYDVKIYGAFPAIYFKGVGDKDKLLAVKQWGEIAWKSMEGAFEGCLYVQVTATDIPNLDQVTNLASMFYKCKALAALDVTGWNVSNVTTLFQTFRATLAMKTLTGLNTWNVGSVTNMDSTFYYCRALTTIDLTGWNTSKVTNTGLMFFGCYKMTSIVGYENWDMSSLSNACLMFAETVKTSFNFSNWKTSGALFNISRMFEAAAVTELKGLDTFDVSNVAAAQGFVPSAFVMPAADYDAMLIAWNQCVATRSLEPITLDMGKSRCTPFSAGDAARTSLMEKNWQINDGGTAAGVTPIPAYSVTSPICVNGWTDGPAFSVSTDGTNYQAASLSGNAWYREVALDPDAALPVSVKYGTTVVASQEVFWTPTLIDEDSGKTVTIRKGDSLLLGSAVTTGTLLELDTDGNGIYDLSGSPTDLFPVPYPVCGSYLVSARIDGQDVGTLTVNVAEVIFPAAVACEIGFTRKLTVRVSTEVQNQLLFSSTTSDLSVVVSSEPVVPGIVKLLIKPLASGTPTLVARHGSPTGPIMATVVVDEFTCGTLATEYIGVVDEFEDGSLLVQTSLYIEPKVENLIYRLNIFKGGVTFEDSTLTKSLNTSNFTLEAGSERALHPYQMILAPDMHGGACHTTRVYQDEVQVGGDL